MQIANNLAFNSQTSNLGNWIDMARYYSWSLHIFGLEAGGSLSLFGSNAMFKPTDGVVDPFAVQIGEAITATNLNTLIGNSGLPTVHWMQIQKTPGGAPTQTTVNLFAQLL